MNLANSQLLNNKKVRTTAQNRLIYLVLVIAVGFLAFTTQIRSDSINGPSPLTVGINLPSCTGSRSRIISSNSELQSQINSSSYNVFCLNPGRYSAIELTTSGNSGQPRYIIPNQSPNTEPWRKSNSENVIIESIEIDAGYWNIHGVSIGEDHRGPYRIVHLQSRANNVVLNRTLIEGGRAMVDMGDGSNHNTIQNSVLRNTQIVPGQDSHCIYHADGSSYNKVLNNEIYNCAGDGLQLKGGVGTIIENNEIYITSDLYTDCNGRRTSNGNCSCAENVIDVKGTGASSFDTKLTFRGNIGYGYRPTDSACAGSGGARTALNFQTGTTDGDSRPIQATYSLIENNVIFDSPLALNSSSTRNITMRNNVLYGSLDQDDGAFLLGANPASQEFYHNTIVSTHEGVTWLKFSPNRSLSQIDIKNNLVINSSQAKNLPSGSGTIIDNNGFVSTSATNLNGNPANDVVTSFNSSQFEPFCFTIHKYTNPTTKCLANVIPKAGNPAIDQGVNSVGQRSEVGIDNTTRVATDIRGLGRDNQPDLGAFEVNGSPLSPSPTQSQNNPVTPGSVTPNTTPGATNPPTPTTTAPTPVVSLPPELEGRYIHPGIDIKPAQNQSNTSYVYSTHAGFVTYAGPAPANVAEKGWMVQIESDLNRDNVADIITRYNHLFPESIMINDFKYKRINYTPNYFMELNGQGVEKLPYGYGPYVARNQLLGIVGDSGSPGHRHLQYEIVTNRYLDTFGADLNTFSCLDDPYIESCSSDPGRPGFFFPINRPKGSFVKGPVYINPGMVTPLPTLTPVSFP